jgi:hypothetical protein
MMINLPLLDDYFIMNIRFCLVYMLRVLHLILVSWSNRTQDRSPTFGSYRDEALIIVDVTRRGGYGFTQA